jgi:hypothetical protein
MRPTRAVALAALAALLCFACAKEIIVGGAQGWEVPKGARPLKRAWPWFTLH